MWIVLRLQREINLAEAKYLRDFMTPGFSLRLDDSVLHFSVSRLEHMLGNSENSVRCMLKRNG